MGPNRAQTTSKYKVETGRLNITNHITQQFVFSDDA